MTRKAFYSFHYEPDNWRAGTVRGIGVIEGNQTVSDNEWEEITSGGDSAIEAWIADQMKGKSCVIVLIGQNTAGRKWITHEIVEGWNTSKGLVGIHIHNLLDSGGSQALKGANPFNHVTVKGQSMSSIVKTYDPPFADSKSVYRYIADNLEEWVEEAIAIRTEN